MTVCCVAWLAPLALSIPRTTSFDLYGLWTPRFGNTARYPGRILDASMEGLHIPSRLVPDQDALDDHLLRRRPLTLRLEVGQAPASTAPIFQINDSRTDPVLELHALGPDLILRGRNPARILKLDQPDARWVGAMEGVPVGDTVTLVVDRGRGSVCMSLDEREQCNLAPSLADGWGHILNLEGPPHWFRATMSVLWALGLGGLIGLTLGTRRPAVVVVGLLAAVGYVGSVVSPDVRPSVVHALVLVAGGLLGTALREPVVHVWKELRAPPT